MKRPGKPRQTTKSFKSLTWDHKKGIVRLKTFDDFLKQATEHIDFSAFLPHRSPLENLSKKRMHEKSIKPIKLPLAIFRQG